MFKKESKRFSIFILIAGAIALQLTAIQTEWWWQQASPVRSVAEIKSSKIFFWKGLRKACLSIPPATEEICKPLKDYGMDGDSITAVRWLMYISIGIACLELVSMVIIYLVTRRLFMDLVAISSLLAALVATAGLGLYTKENPTLFSFFDLYGYSYICGWLGVCCHVLASYASLLLRLDHNGVSFLGEKEMVRHDRKKSTAVELE
ncbi:uncharacterized protein [Clytia hemisphaerica]